MPGMLGNSTCAARRCVARAYRALALLPLLAAGAAQGATPIDAIVIKYRDGSASAQVSQVPARDQQALGHLRKIAITEVARTRDGAVRVAIDPPMDIDDARAAVNRVRMNPDVLYAGFAPRAAEVPSTPDARAMPVRAMMVKYKDADLVAAALANRPPTAQAVQRVADATRTPVATLRAMAGGAYVMELFQAMSVTGAQAAAEALEADPAIEFAEPDVVVFPATVPNDPCYPVNSNAACLDAQGAGYLFHWNLMPPASEAAGANLPAAWDLTTGSSRIYVGVIDTGFLYSHPDLQGRAIGGYDFIYDFARANDGQPAQVPTCLQGNDPRLYKPLDPPCVSSRDNDPADPGDWINAADYPGDSTSWFWFCPISPSTWHGAQMSGTIGAASNNATGVTGINWVSKIVPLRALGKCGGVMSDIIDAMTWGSGGSVPGIPANPYPVRVLTMNWSAWKPCGSLLQNAVTAALARGTMMVVPAGNGNASAYDYLPGNCTGVLAVAAHQRQGLKAEYSNFGVPVSLSAPGGGKNYPETPSVVTSFVASATNAGATVPGSLVYGRSNGTSTAAAHVAGVASLMLSRNSKLTAAQVQAYLETTTRPFLSSPANACPSAQSCTCATWVCGAGMLDAGAAVAAVPALPPKRIHRIDFNADGKDDLLWRHQGSGATAVWVMNGMTALSKALVYGGGPYVVTNTGDLDGDGKTDLIFKATGGPTAGWLMNGTTVAASSILFSDPLWSVKRTLQFGYRSNADLLWRGTGSTLALWYMNGLAISGYSTPDPGPNWVPTHLGDFADSGNTDIVLRNTVTGQTAIWMLDAFYAGPTVILGDPNWVVTHTADLDNDGKSDLVWRNNATGATAVWLMSGTAPKSTAVLLGNPQWQVTNVGDFNGDGYADLVWRNDTIGQTAIWLMNGTTAASAAVILADPAWRVTHVADTNGDGKSDLLWHHDTAGTALWIMNGTTATSAGIILSDSMWIIAPPDGF